MDPSRPRSPQAKSTAPSPSVSGASSAAPQAESRTAPAPAQARPAPPQAQHQPAVGPASVKTPSPPRVEAPVVQAGPLEHLAIAPQPTQGSDQSIEFDWESAALGTNRSYACTITADPSHGLSVTLEQGMYRRSFDGLGVVKTPVIPPAPFGTRGSLTARDLVTGASTAFTWQWQPQEAQGADAPPPSKAAGLIGRLFGRAKAATAKTGTKGKVATVAERLGARAPLAVSLKFFGQEAIGQRFAFILDRSGSMSGRRWKACTSQLEIALRSMSERVEFFVVLFSSVDLEPKGQSGWMPAEPGRVEDVIRWIRGINPGGGTYPATAFKRVFSLPSPPDVIYFLTDGELDGFTPASCDRLRGTAPTIVNTIALENSASAEALRETAAITGGQFILVGDVSAEEAHG